MKRLFSLTAAATTFPLHPFIVSAVYVVGYYGNSFVPAEWLVRPVVVSLAVAAILLAVGYLMHRQRHLAGITASTLVIVAIGDLRLLLLLVAGALALAVTGWWLSRTRATQVAPGQLTGPLNTLSLAWLMVAIVWAVPNLTASSVRVDSPGSLDASSARPNIHILLLDGYARADTLADFGYDNRPFLADLSDRGFFVVEDSYSNYRVTTQTLASMFSARHVVDLPVEVPNGSAAQRRVLWAVINNAPVIEELRRLGYSYVVSPARAAETWITSADVRLAPGYVNEFELHLILSSLAGRITVLAFPDILIDQHRGWVLANFSHFSSLHPEDAPVVSFTHVLSPHTPFVFTADGSKRHFEPCLIAGCQIGTTIEQLGITRDDYIDGYSAQLTFVNAKVLDAIDTIVAADPLSVIVVMSDHGSRYSFRDGDEWYRNLLAARTPGRDGAFNEVRTPVNVFPALFNAYFGASYELQPDTQFDFGEAGELNVWPRGE